jgi:CTP-dependent riboflavin kinase
LERWIHHVQSLPRRIVGPVGGVVGRADVTGELKYIRCPTLVLVGEACSGLGEGASFTALEWVRREFLSKLGFEPYPGTFNLRMGGADWEAAKRIMARGTGIAITPEP